MEEWKKVAAAVFPAAVLLSFLIVFIRRCCRSSSSSSKKESNSCSESIKMKHSDSLQSGIAKLHLQYEGNNDHKNLSNFHHLLDLEKKRRTNYYVFRRGLSVNPLFSWADHPSLVSEAVEHGWARFAFTGGFMSSSSSTSTRSVLLGLCVSSVDQTKESKPEISWEICPGSSDFMQKIRLNSGLKKGIIGTPSPLGASSVIKTALPLPGPFLGNFSFPQEAYFEITIISVREDDVELIGNGKESSKKKEGEKTKLIQETQDVNSRSDSLSHVSIDSSRFEELKVGNKEESKEETVMMSLGLTVGGTLPSKLPGSYPGSIGFNSNASVYLDGMDLVFEAEKAPWGIKDKVIGCGFDPEQKKVFFTVDSELVHVIHCTSEEFSSPLYPTLAANVDITVLVNFGQSAFIYAPANVQRIPNPCFLGPQAFMSEDSQELFSIGRIDSQWSKRSTTLNNSNNNNRNSIAVDIDGESETDFFEITLDNRSRTSTAFRNEV